MPSWALRSVLPDGTSFKGEIVYPMTSLEVPNTFRKYVESLEVSYSDSLYVIKDTGFEHKKYQREATGGIKILATVSIMLVGDLPRWLMCLLINLAIGCNGGGMWVDFYDDWATDKQYTGRWYNAVDFVENSELLCGGSIELECFIIQAIS